jgi:hypothetical protein
MELFTTASVDRRGQPGLFAGLAASRFLKASSERRYKDRWPPPAARAIGYGSSTYSGANDRYRTKPITPRELRRVAGERDVEQHQGTELRERPLGEVLESDA